LDRGKEDKMKVKTPSEKELVKEALHGWIADKRKNVNCLLVYARVLNVADKYGVFAPSYVRMIDLIREIGYKVNNNGNFKLS